jgi:ligand-binding sensor domain-containing protein
MRLALVILILAQLAWAQPFQWQTFTSTSDVRDIESVNGSLWAATSGGLVHFDPSSGLFDVYTNTRGLSTNRCVAVGADSRGGIWVGFEDRRLNRLDAETGRVQVLPDLQDEVFTIMDIISWEDFVLVASDVGAYRLAYYETVGAFRVQESYSKLGNLSPRTEVRRLAIADGYLWAATPYGLARADLDQPTLVPPSAWENINQADGLPNNDVSAITAAPGGGLWIGTALGAVRWLDGNFAGRSDFGGVRDFATVNDTVYAITSARTYWYDTSFGWQTIGDANPFSVVRLAAAASAESEQVLWGAVADASNESGGIAAFIGAQWSEALRADGPNGDEISALAIGADGKLWVGTKGARGGVSVYSNGQWKNYIGSGQFSAPFFNGEVRSFAFDDFGGTWVGTHSKGLGWIRGDSVRVFNSNDSTGARLTGVSEDANFCLVDAVVKDAGGNLWLTNRRSTRNTPLLRIAREWIAADGPDTPWMSYVNPNPRGPTEVERLIIDGFDRKWLGASPDGGGTHILDDRGTPLDTVGDRWSFFVPNELTDPTFCFEDVDNYVKCWAIDAEGYLWVGTINGVYYTPTGIPQDLSQLQFMCLYPRPLGTQVFSIYVDAEDNKWFGTDGGVSVMDRDFNWIHYFRTADDVLYPSNLISNDVTAITSNPATGEVWIGTPDGLSRLKTPYQVTGGELGEIEPYPNPFHVGRQHMYVQDMGVFDEMRVFNLSGRLVRKLSWREMITPGVGWDGRNDDGKLVASGIYVLVSYTQDGKTARGKVAVLAE